MKTGGLQLLTDKDNKIILIIGGTGFIGQELGLHLARQGHVLRLTTRRPEQVRGRLAFPCELYQWSGVSAPLPTEALAGADVVINLLGESIASHAWTSKRRAAIRDSRVQSVAALVKAIEALPGRRPSVVIQASAIGFYGDRGDEQLPETAPPGTGFLADVCQAWEHEAAPLQRLAIRTVHCRFGMVLGATGGALPQLQLVYSMGLGARLGSGKQWMSWVHIDDLVRLIDAAIGDERWQGPVNVTSPEPCQFSVFNRRLGELGRYGHRMIVPTPLVRLAMGQRSALVLDSARAEPAAALARGFRFKFASIDAALADLCGGSERRHLNRLVVRQWLPIPVEKLWPFFTDAHNLEKLVPAFLRFHVEGLSTPAIGEGTRIKYRLRIHGIPVHWESLICDWDPGKKFVDEQLRGPYGHWRHLHSFEALAGGTLMTDDVRFNLPLAPLGSLVAGLFVQKDVQNIFAYRTKVLADGSLIQSSGPSRDDGRHHGDVDRG